MADQDDIQEADTEKLKTPSPEQKEDEAALVELEKGITTFEKLLSDLKRYDQALKKINQKRRENMIKALDGKMKYLAKEWADLSSAAQKASQGEIDKHTMRVCRKYQSYWDQKDAISETIDSWFGADDLIFGKDSYTIYEAYRKTFDKIEDTEKYDAPQFAQEVSRIYHDEASARNFLIDRLSTKKLSLEITSTKEFFLPSQPNAQQLQDLESQLAQKGAEKRKLLERMSMRQKFYETFRGRLLEHEQANALKEERELSEKDIDRVEQGAARTADRYLAELESTDESYYEELTSAGRVPVQRSVSSAVERQISSPRATREVRAAGGPGWLKFLRDPGGSIRGFLSRFSSKGKESTQKAIIQQGEGALKKGAVTRLGTVGGAIGLAISLGIRLLTDKELQEKLKNAALFAGLNLYLWLVGLMTNLVAGAFGIAGGIAGIIVGAKIGAAIGAAVGGPVGAVIGGIIGGGVGGVVGWVAGYGVGNIVSGALGIGGGPAFSAVGSSASTTTFGTTVGVATGGFWGLFTGTSTTAIASVSIGTAMAAIGTAAVITAPPPQTENEGPQPIFEIAKTADPANVPNFATDDGPKTITYSLTATSKSNVEIQIKSVSDTAQIYSSQNGKKLSVFAKSAIQWSQSDMKLAPNSALTGTYTVTIDPTNYFLPELNDSTLVNTITLVGETTTVQPESRTESTTEDVKIGNPTDQTPYGYPASGVITSIDSYNGHCGTFLTVYGRLCRSSYDDGKTSGGLDVAGPNQPVYATLDGTVELAGIDTGLAGQDCGQYGRYTLCKWALGGVVYVRSFSGQYLAAYLHLDNLQVKTGDKVAQGKQIGTIFDGELPTTKSLYGNNPGHVHYQVLRDGLNVNFAGNSGSCTAGNLLPSEPGLQNSVSAGPFECGGGI